MPQRMRKTSGDTLQIGEYAVAPLGPQPRQRAREIAVIINVRAIVGIGHWHSCPAVGQPDIGTAREDFLEAFQGICRGHINLGGYAI